MAGLPPAPNLIADFPVAEIDLFVGQRGNIFFLADEFSQQSKAQARFSRVSPTRDTVLLWLNVYSRHLPAGKVTRTYQTLGEHLGEFPYIEKIINKFCLQVLSRSKSYCGAGTYLTFI